MVHDWSKKWPFDAASWAKELGAVLDNVNSLGFIHEKKPSQQIQAG